MRFSERYGYRPIRSQLQVESIDEPLRNGLWNVLYNAILHDWVGPYLPEHHARIVKRFWMEFLKQPIDRIPSTGADFVRKFREIFFLHPWYDVYDLLEFFCEQSSSLFCERAGIFVKLCNDVMTKEMSAWRVVGQHIARITSEEEIAAIEEAERPTDKFTPVSTHIRSAVALLADRQNPDYRNSIKESISAVEAICRITTKEPTLGKALKSLPQKGVIVDPAIEGAFHKLYGYTNGPQGIRHALLDQETLDHDDAKFMLVACSAFVNLVRARAPAS